MALVSRRSVAPRLTQTLPLSLLASSFISQVLRLSCLLVWGISFFVSIATFKGIASFSYSKPIGLFVVYLVFPIVCVLVYVVSQLVLVIRTLDDRWVSSPHSIPLGGGPPGLTRTLLGQVIGDILFGTGFFTAGCVIMFAFSPTICDAVEHYIDGLFFFVLCMLLSVMMVYKVGLERPDCVCAPSLTSACLASKYWDSITREDLEFAVGDKGAVWEVKEWVSARL